MVSDPGELVDGVGGMHESEIIDLKAGGTPGNTTLKPQSTAAAFPDPNGPAMPGKGCTRGINFHMAGIGSLIVTT